MLSCQAFHSCYFVICSIIKRASGIKEAFSVYFFTVKFKFIKLLFYLSWMPPVKRLRVNHYVLIVLLTKVFLLPSSHFLPADSETDSFTWVFWEHIPITVSIHMLLWQSAGTMWLWEIYKYIWIMNSHRAFHRSACFKPAISHYRVQHCSRQIHTQQSNINGSLCDKTTLQCQIKLLKKTFWQCI